MQDEANRRQQQPRLQRELFVPNEERAAHLMRYNSSGRGR
jgi:hypothetical protein